MRNSASSITGSRVRVRVSQRLWDRPRSLLPVPINEENNIGYNGGNEEELLVNTGTDIGSARTMGMGRGAGAGAGAGVNMKEFNDIRTSDVDRFTTLLTNVSQHLEHRTEVALSVVSEHMGWLLSKNVPKLAQMVPSIDSSAGLQQGYTFVMDFLEVIVKETASLRSKHQATMKKLFDALSQSKDEPALNAFLKANREEVTSASFLVYLDSELENAPSDSSAERFLLTLKLRLLQEVGEGMGDSVAMLPRLLTLDEAEMRAETLLYLSDLDRDGKELFGDNIRLMRADMRKKYVELDPQLEANLSLLEQITHDAAVSTQTDNH